MSVRRHAWNKKTGVCSACGMHRRFRQSRSLRTRDRDVLFVRYIEISRDGDVWTKVTRGFKLPPCVPKEGS